jgi:hypothetical protein
MIRSFRFWCFAAAGISVVTSVLHVVGGGPEFHQPALSSAMPSAWKAAFSTIWHQISALLFLNGVFLAFTGTALRKNTLLLWLVLLLNAAFGILFFAYGLARLGEPWTLLKWVIFAVISGCIALALWLRDSLQSVEEISARPDHYAVLPGASFADSYVFHGAAFGSTMEVASGALGKAPAWIEALMRVRHILVRPFGLIYAPEQVSSKRIGIFPVLQDSQDSVVLGLNDKHLDFRVVVELFNAGRSVSLTTLVKPHNAFGKAYLTLIMPFHRLIAATILKQTAG